MPGSISDRVRDSVTNMEHQFWRARLDKGSSMIEYLDPECVFISPTDGILTSSSSPTLQEKLEDDNSKTFSTYEIQDVEVVEISMMAATACYRLVASKTNGTGQQTEYRALCSTTWKQGSNSEWTMCVHQESPYAA